MKIILNKCFGGFGLSAKAYKLYCEKKGLECYFYKTVGLHTYKKIDFDNACKTSYFYCFTKDLGKTTTICSDDNAKYDLHLNKSLREDKTLIEVVEELREEANSWASRLVIVEIPDNLNYVIDDYDGFETLHEKVQEW